METDIEESLELDTSTKTISLKRPISCFQKLPHFNNYEQLSNTFNSQNSYFMFDNTLCKKDVKYVLYKLSQLKKKKTKRVLSGCKKVFKKDPNYFWAYLVAGAACRNYDKHYHDTPFYFSQAILINPNSLTAWWCLLKYYRDNNFISNIIFETIFSALLHNERDLGKWCSIVTELLEKSSGPYVLLRKPLKLLVPFIYFGENEKLLFLSHAISEYLFKHRKEKNSIDNISGALEVFKIHHAFYPADEAFARKALSYTFCSGDYKSFIDFLEYIFYFNRIQDTTFKSQFFLKIMSLIPLISLNNTNHILLAILKIYRRKVTEIRKKAKTRYPIICCSFGDFGTARDLYEKRKKKRRTGQHFTIREKIAATWSYIEVGNLVKAYKSLICLTKQIGHKLKKKRCKCKTNVLKKSILNIWLHILTHGPTVEMRKLGVLLCLKMINTNKATVEVFYYACIGFIGLNMESMAINCLLHLEKYGAINEIIYLKALLEKSYLQRLDLLNEISEFVVAQKLKAVSSQIFEKESKAFKAIYKASVEVPGCVFLYEWIGIFLYERGDYVNAEKYFEAALFYNSESWTSIDYYPSLLAKRNITASKQFLDLYRHRRKFSKTQLIACRAGIQYFTFKTKKMDYFKAAENFMFAHRLQRGGTNSNYVELIGESLSLFGMFGASKNWLSECYIMKNTRNIYAGTQLAKQILLKSGVRKYSNFMMNLIKKGGMDTFMSLYHGAYAFLLRSRRLTFKNRHHLSQIYCQLALFLCARALIISSTFACAWKLMGDIFYQCGSLTPAAGYLYVPDWLFPECSSGKVILIRRLQSLKLAIRCYFSGISPSASNRMRACLWNSAAIAYRKASTLCSVEGRKKCIDLGIDCCLKALKDCTKDSHTWNTLGVLLKYYGYRNEIKEEVYEHSTLAFEKSMKFCRIPLYRHIAAANLGFLCLMNGDVEKAEMMFLFSRGRNSYLDFPWIGQVLVNLVRHGKWKDIYNNILFTLKCTNHHPKICVLFLFLNILSHYQPKAVIKFYGKKYKRYCGANISSFKEYLFSSILNSKEKRFNIARLELLYALRTVNGLHNKERYFYDNALYELQSLYTNHSLKLALLRTVNLHFRNARFVVSLCAEYIKGGFLSHAYYELLKYLAFEKNPRNRGRLHFALGCISLKSGASAVAKKHFHYAQKKISGRKKKLIIKRKV